MSDPLDVCETCDERSGGLCLANATSFKLNVQMLDACPRGHWKSDEVTITALPSIEQNLIGNPVDEVAGETADEEEETAGGGF